MNGFKATGACVECKGACCKHVSGALSPADVGEPMLQKLVILLSSGRYCVDYWEGGDNAHFIRPALKGKEGDIVDPAWGGECTFLTPNGCSHPYENRPQCCRYVEPQEDFKCSLVVDGQPVRNSKRYYCDQWLPYQDEIHKAIALARGE